ncbi:cupin domain-containing protein [Motiliproteus sp. MSK22-1]|uniref:cupin domain-containing protein n=1 Tax=Motiliproteus sp. MSK22-1 TaxID=1897630 RepID=UPI0018E9CD09|nr:cupin domain-containing protein [Motiliproteus sp. MSK22-1]
MPTSIKQVIDFSASTVEGSVSTMAPERCLRGQPEQTLWNQFQDSTKQMLSGIWECTEGKWNADYSSKNEFCHILAGKVVLTDEAGGASTFSVGDSFVIPAGFVGTWEVLEPVRKLYVIVTPN